MAEPKPTPPSAAGGCHVVGFYGGEGGPVYVDGQNFKTAIASFRHGVDVAVVVPESPTACLITVAVVANAVVTNAVHLGSATKHWRRQQTEFVYFLEKSVTTLAHALPFIARHPSLSWHRFQCIMLRQGLFGEIDGARCPVARGRGSRGSGGGGGGGRRLRAARARRLPSSRPPTRRRAGRRPPSRAASFSLRSSG